MNELDKTFDLPLGDRLMINLKRQHWDLEFASVLQPNDPPVRSNKADVILIHSKFSDDYMFENRWTDSNELVDYDVIQYVDEGRLDLSLQLVKRIKIAGLQFAQLPLAAHANLLRCLSGFTWLEQLEMDGMRLMIKANVIVDFHALRLLSINCIQIVNEDGTAAAPNERNFLWLHAPYLETVYAGEDRWGQLSIDFIDFHKCYNLDELHISSLASNRWLNHPPFDALKILTIDKYRSGANNSLRNLILQIAQGKLLKQLAVLCCNYKPLKSASDLPEPNECAQMADLYQCLANDPTVRDCIRLGLQIYLHGLLFEPQRPFSECGFSLNLIHFHYNNMRDQFPVLTSLYSVASVAYLDVLDTFLRVEDDGSVSLDNGINRFHQLYPNLRSIIVYNLKGLHRGVSPRVLLAFLNTCCGVLELELWFGKLDATFYEQLTELASVQNLRSLRVHESKHFYDRLDFGFLKKRFRSLRTVHLNIATQLVMFSLLEAIPVNGTYIFDFWVRGQSFNQVQISRTDLNAYELLVKLYIYRKDAAKELYRQTYDDLIDLEDALVEGQPGSTHHWLHHWLDPASQHLRELEVTLLARVSPEEAAESDQELGAVGGAAFGGAFGGATVGAPAQTTRTALNSPSTSRVATGSLARSASVSTFIGASAASRMATGERLPRSVPVETSNEAADEEADYAAFEQTSLIASGGIATGGPSRLASVGTTTKTATAPGSGVASGSLSRAASAKTSAMASVRSSATASSNDLTSLPPVATSTSAFAESGVTSGSLSRAASVRTSTMPSARPSVRASSAASSNDLTRLAPVGASASSVFNEEAAYVTPSTSRTLAGASSFTTGDLPPAAMVSSSTRTATASDGATGGLTRPDPEGASGSVFNEEPAYIGPFSTFDRTYADVVSAGASDDQSRPTTSASVLPQASASGDATHDPSRDPSRDQFAGPSHDPSRAAPVSTFHEVFDDESAYAALAGAYGGLSVRPTASAPSGLTAKPPAKSTKKPLTRRFGFF